MSIKVRDARIDEAPAIKALIEEHALASFGEPELSEDEIRSWFSQPKLWIQLAERDGRLAGYLDVNHEGESRFDVDARTLEPDIAPVLVAAAEEYARGRAESPVLHGYAQGEEPVIRQAYEAAGWQPIRYSFQMRTELDRKLPEPAWPDGLTPRNVRPGEEERVYDAHMDSFADHWDFRLQSLEDWRVFTVEKPNFDPALWWLVEDAGELAAISLNQWHFSGDPEFGWIQVLGVRPSWRRRGLATALLQHSFRDFHSRGATRVGLGVDGENTTGAVKLYESVGMRQVRRNETYEKTL
jgi:mycothiol synthase